MAEAACMFDPLSTKERAAAQPDDVGRGKARKTPMVLVPANAPPMDYRHRKHSEPTKLSPSAVRPHVSGSTHSIRPALLRVLPRAINIRTRRTSEPNCDR